MKRPGGSPPRAALNVVLASLVVVSALTLAVLALAACGGSSSTATPPSAMALPSTAPSQSATPLPTPTVAGTIAFMRIVRSGDNGNGDIYIVDTDGTGLKRLTNGPSWEDSPTWSPDGSKIAYGLWQNDQPASATIWSMNADGSGKVKLTKGAVRGVWPMWSPDGKQIAFWRETSSGEIIYVMNADGSGLKAVAGGISVWEESPGGPEGGAGMAWTPDGKILFLRSGDVFAVYPDGNGLVQMTKGADLGTFGLSPDGTRIALENSVRRLYVAPMRGSGVSVTLLDPVYHYMSDPWTVPTWSPDGNALAIASSSLFGMIGSRLYIINADGSGLSKVPGVGNADDPDWRPR